MITLPIIDCNFPWFQVSSGNSRTMVIIFSSGRGSAKKPRQPFCSYWFAYRDYGFKFRFTKRWPPDLQA